MGALMDKPIKISSAMVSEGLRVYEELKETYDGQSLVEAVYRAMASVDRSGRSRAKAERNQCVIVPNAYSDDCE